AFSPDGAVLASGGGEGLVRRWEVRTRKELPQLETGDRVTALAYSPGGEALATGAMGKVRLWGLPAGGRLREFKGHTGGVYAVAFSPDGAQLASGDMGRVVRLWDIKTGKCLAELSESAGSEYLCCCLCFSPDGRTLAAAYSDRKVRLWDVRTGRLARRL